MANVKRNLRTNFLSRSVAIGLAASVSIIAISPAMAQQAMPINIPAQSAPDAITRLARQTGTQILFDHAQLRRVRTRPVNATVSPREAVRIMLEGSGFEVAPTPSGALVIRPIAAVAQTSGGGTTSSSGEGGPERTEEIVVVGSRLPTSATSASARPVTTFDRERIAQTGASNAGDVLNYLPQQSTTNITSTRFAGGANFVALRGLPADFSLVLINGRRAVPTGPTVQFNAVDLNAIPLAAIERIEVLSDAASALYGADAVGGVVNIVLKTDPERPVIDLRVGGADGGATEWQGSLTLGGTIGRLTLLGTADYFRRGQLLGEERDLFANLDYRRFGSIDRRFLFANPTTISSLTAANLPGLPSRIAAVPAGSTGIGLTPSAFIPTAGVQSVTSITRYFSVMPATERLTFFGTARYDFDGGTSAYGEFSYVDRSTRSFTFPSTLALTIPANNPFNPFGVAVSANYLLTGLGPRASIDEGESFRAVLGLRGSVGRWAWDIYGLRTEDRGRSWTRGSVNAALVQAAANSTDPATALNVFQDGPGGSPALLSSFLAPVVFRDNGFNATQLAGTVNGELFSLPAGPFRLALGGEYRDEEMQVEQPPSVFTRPREVRSAYLEANLPLVSADMAVPAVHSLGLTGAIRLDDYSDFGSTWNPQISLDYSPVAAVSLRASYGTSFRAPSLLELYLPRQTIPGVIADPRRGNETTAYSRLFGGNPDLEPIAAETGSLRLVYAPDRSWRVSLTGWSIRIDRRVGIQLSPAVLANEDLFPGVVIRDTPTAADIAAGRPGRILSIIEAYQNFGRLKTEGVDLAVEGRTDTAIGRLGANVAATWVGTYRTLDAPGTAPVERVGLAYSLGTVPEWKVVATASWDRQPFAASASLRFTSGYEDADQFLGSPVGRRISSQALVDLQGSVRLERLLATPAITLRFGVINLFNRLPSFAEIGGIGGYDRSQGDLRGRFAYAALSAAF